MKKGYNQFTSFWNIDKLITLFLIKFSGKTWAETAQIMSEKYNRSFDVKALQTQYEKYYRLIDKSLFEKKEKTNTTQNLEEIIKKSIEKINKKNINFKIIKSKNKIDEIANLVLSDLHIGEKNTGMEIYNTEIFKKRWEYIIQKIVYIKENILCKAYNITELNIYMLGDMITNEVLFKTQPFQIDMILTDQIFVGAKIVAEGINILSQHFEKIYIYSVNGNHGRVSKNNAESTNWDYIFYKCLEQYLSGNKRIIFKIEKDDFKQIIDVYDYKLMILHGDKIPMYNRTPHYGIENSIARWVSFYIDNYPNLKYFCIGHFHTSGIYNWNKRKIILNGTFNSGGQFAEKIIKLHPSISQWFFGINKNRGITWQFELDFQKIM